MIDEALGKILGMAMAYGVSSLGLLFAYYNYRKRIVKAEKAFTPTAWAMIAGIVAISVVAGALAVRLARLKQAERAEKEKTEAVKVLEAETQKETRKAELVGEKAAASEELPVGAKPRRLREDFPSWLGWVVPLLIFAFSFWVTWALYRHFARRMEEEMGK